MNDTWHGYGTGKRGREKQKGRKEERKGGREGGLRILPDKQEEDSARFLH